MKRKLFFEEVLFIFMNHHIHYHGKLFLIILVVQIEIGKYEQKSVV
jgi:hypothetical protein